MNQSSRFVIENDCNFDISLFVEPEGVVVLLKPDETVLVRDQHQNTPVTVRVSSESLKTMALSLWPGDGDMVVTKNGRDVLTQ